MSKMHEHAAASSPLDSSVPGAAAPGWVGRVQQILKQRWRWVLAACVPCALLAVGMGLLFGQKMYVAEGTLLYHAPPVPESVKGVYTPSSFQTLADLVKSPNNLEALAAEFQLRIPPAVFAKLIEVKTGYNTEKITVRLEWPERDQSAALVNKLMDIYIAQVAAIRRSTLESQYASSKEGDERLKPDPKLDGGNIADLNTELEKVKRELASQETTLAAERSRQDNLLAQIEKQKEDIKALKFKAQDDAVETSKKRIADLNRQITEKMGSLEEAKKILKDRKEDWETERRLLASKATTAEKVAKAKLEVDTWTTRVKTLTASINELKDAIKAEMANPSSPLLDAARARLRELEAQLAGVDGQIDKLAKAQTALQLRTRQLKALLTRALMDFKEFEVVDRARPADAAYSTAKKYAIPAFVVPFVLFLGLIVVRDLRSSSGQAEALASELGLPLLARCAGGTKGMPPEQARGLALRLRQYVSEAGGTILLSPVNDGDDVDDLMEHLGRYLAMRDERVLFLDARIARSRPAALSRLVERPVEMVLSAGQTAPQVSGQPCLSGLVQHLVFEGHDPAEFIHPTGLGAVDFLPAGGPYPMTDVLASEPMKELLDGLRKKYSVILIAGPPASNTIDTEILAAYVNGIIVVLNGPAKQGAALGTFFHSLREANVPLLGAVQA
jgi:predicted  nucleic acid-binding Zn-ribbon protein